MICSHCQSPAVRRRKQQTALGYGRFSCGCYHRRLNERTGTPFNELQYPTDIVLLAVQDRARPHDCRNYELTLFLLDTGVRASECVSIRLGDVDWERGRVRVLHGKGQKQRWVGVGERTMTALRDYIARFRGDGAGGLFLVSRSGEPIKTAHGLHVILRRVAEIAGVEHVHPHRFRHTFATWAIAS